MNLRELSAEIDGLDPYNFVRREARRLQSEAEYLEWLAGVSGALPGEYRVVHVYTRPMSTELA